MSIRFYNTLPREKQKFARLVESVEAARDRQAGSTAQIEGMFQGLMQRAFRGEPVT